MSSRKKKLAQYIEEADNEEDARVYEKELKEVKEVEEQLNRVWNYFGKARQNEQDRSMICPILPGSAVRSFPCQCMETRKIQEKSDPSSTNRGQRGKEKLELEAAWLREFRAKQWEDGGYRSADAENLVLETCRLK